MEFDIVELSRLQFAMTAMYHFLFVPLTLGLSILVAIMETVYVMTNRPIWRQMTKFWGMLFGINFALGVATGITMEFKFGMNWSYYSHYVGDIFGAPLAIEGLMAFFLEASFVGLFFFGWDKLSKVAHLSVAWLVAIGSNFSALWILITNGWMQSPVGAEFNPMTMRMEMTDFFAVLFNEVAQAKFVHTVSAGYVTASVFVLGVSAWYLLRGRHIELARRSITVAAAFGLASAFSVVLLGDESGYSATHSQKMKLAAIEAMWETHEAPAPFNLIGFPDQEIRETHYAIEIPWAMGLIGTRSLTTEIPGINDLVATAEDRIRSGMIAYEALLEVRKNRDATDPVVSAQFEAHSADLGFAFLLKKPVDNPLHFEVARTGSWLSAYADRPWIVVAPVMGIIGGMLTFLGLRAGREVSTLLFSKMAILGVISSVGLTMFPFIMPSSSDPQSSLTVWNSSSSHLTLFIMLVVTAIFMPLILIYTACVYKVLRGQGHRGCRHRKLPLCLLRKGLQCGISPGFLVFRWPQFSP